MKNVSKKFTELEKINIDYKKYKITEDDMRLERKTRDIAVHGQNEVIFMPFIRDAVARFIIKGSTGNIPKLDRVLIACEENYGNEVRQNSVKIGQKNAIYYRDNGKEVYNGKNPEAEDRLEEASKKWGGNVLRIAGVTIKKDK